VIATYILVGAIYIFTLLHQVSVLMFFVFLET